MRIDANRIALRAIRSILEAAHPLDLDVAGAKVTCTVSREPEQPWPSAPVEGVRQEVDGPWPASVRVAASWEGGQCTLELQCTFDHRNHAIALGAYASSSTPLVWVNVGRRIRSAQDGEVVDLRADAYLKKRKSEAQSRLSQLLSSLVGASTIPAESQWKYRVFSVDVPSGAVHESPATAFRHLVHLALFKLDFFSRGEEAKARGKPLIDIAQRTGLPPTAFETSAVDDDQEEDDDGPDGDLRARRYWAGGFQWGDESKREEFVTKNYWQVGWPRSSAEAPAQTTWRRFDEIQPGDLFAIKGYGGSHDLLIHYVGEVESVDHEAGRLSLKRREAPKYVGKAPRGQGGGNWFDTLVPITRKDVIAAIFGAEQAESTRPRHAYEDVPLNLILYGPPGTGKTYRLQQEYLDRFTRREKEVREVDALAARAAELTYFEVLVAAVHSAPGKRASVDQILEHPLVRAKYQTNAPKSMRQIAWGTLGAHTVDGSKTVKTKRRFGELVFDKDPDGRWYLPNALPPELQEMAERANQKKNTPTEVKDYDFVTFHQAYSYEDFIEGIRPQLEGEGSEDEERVGYALRDGIFKEAVKSALRLARYDGTIDDFCKLTRDQRSRYFEDAPHYAIFIDEINRGNVARVFGELITLLEGDKRLGCENEVIVKLPYSGSRFGVPPNLHVIGTMNTADRSVEALDAALRRRFEFQELGPLPEKLTFTIDGPIDPQQMLRTINRRLEKLRDRDHCIGHAYFLPLEETPTLDALKQVFATKILPLLQEYFFGDWGKIGLVLGKDFVQRREDDVEFADFDHDDRDALRSRATYEITPTEKLTDISFRRIYENVS